MSNPQNYDAYNVPKMLFLVFDVEKYLDNADTSKKHTITKMFFYTNRNYISSKLARPYALKFVLTDGTEQTWNVQNMFDNLNHIPFYMLRCNLKHNYTLIDIADKIYPFDDKPVAIEKFASFENDAHNFDLSLGQVGMSKEATELLSNVLSSYEIDHTITTETITIGKTISIPLNGVFTVIPGDVIAPRVQKFDGIDSIGTYKVRNGMITKTPDTEHIALIVCCYKCKKYFVYDWCGTAQQCPHCAALCSI